MFKKLVYLLFSLLILSGLQSKAQTFDMYIANDNPTDSITYEFDVMIRSTTATDWCIRTVQMGFTINPLWLPVGVLDPAITYVNGSATLLNYTPGGVEMNASPASLSAFQIKGNAAAPCSLSTHFTFNGQTEKVGRFRIVSNSGPMNCVPTNISFIRPTDPTPGGHVNLRVAVHKWSDPECIVLTSLSNTNNGTYMNVPSAILIDQYNNMAPTITMQPIDRVSTTCDSIQFFISANSVIGQNTALTYQWYENGTSIANNAIFNGTDNDTLTITNPPVSMNGNTFYVVVTQCGIRKSDSVSLSVTTCTTSISEADTKNEISIYPNPTKGKINIYFSTDLSVNRMEILNSLSQVVYHSDIKTKNGLTKELNLDLPNGIYFIRFYSMDSFVQRRIVVE